jgi:hypothetical protein
MFDANAQSERDWKSIQLDREDRRESQALLAQERRDLAETKAEERREAAETRRQNEAIAAEDRRAAAAADRQQQFVRAHPSFYPFFPTNP